jgi:TonB family protein
MQLGNHAWTRRFSFALAALALFSLAGRAPASAQADADLMVPTYHAVKEALAFIVAKSPYGTMAGSGFCISSTATTSYVLTNHHVIANGQKILVAFQSPTLKKAFATVFRDNPDDDIAILAVPIGNIPPLALAKGRPPEGTRIATAGYPSTDIELAMAGMGLTPSLHVGLINALPAKGNLILFDAQTEHGNSGGPLFDIHTGLVYGVVFAKMGGYRESNLAISLAFLGPFLSGSHLALAPIPSGQQHPATPPPTVVEDEPLTVTNAAMLMPAQPVYPAIARANGWSGAVEVRVDLDAAGTVTNALILKSSGHAEFDDAALVAAKDSTYRPKRVGGKGVPVTYTARYVFAPQ